MFIDTPSESTQIFQNEQVTLRANATDRDGQDVTCEWRSSQGADPVQGPGDDATFEESILVELTLEATDQDGITRSRTIDLIVGPYRHAMLWPNLIV